MSWYSLHSAHGAETPGSDGLHPVASGGGSPLERQCAVALALLAMVMGVAVALF